MSQFCWIIFAVVRNKWCLLNVFLNQILTLIFPQLFQVTIWNVVMYMQTTLYGMSGYIQKKTTVYPMSKRWVTKILNKFEINCHMLKVWIYFDLNFFYLVLDLDIIVSSLGGRWGELFLNQIWNFIKCYIKRIHLACKHFYNLFLSSRSECCKSKDFVWNFMFMFLA
jgi:hypothetical protein